DTVRVRDDGFEHVAHHGVVGVALVVKDVASCDGGLCEMPDQRPVLERQGAEPVGIELHDGCLVYAFEQVLAIGRGVGGVRHAGGRSGRLATASGNDE